MGSKLSPGNFDCYHNALPDEPMFILLARDPDAAYCVRLWAGMRARRIHTGERAASDEALVNEASECADNMERWRQANEGVWRQIVPEGSRLVPRPWSAGKPDVLVAFEAGSVIVNGKHAGQSMDADEQTIWTAFHNRKVGLLAQVT